MSTLVMSACWNLQMPPTPKAVLISLADNANDHGECWPSIPKISQRTCFSERAVHGAIKWLEEHGLVIADRSNGRHTLYVVRPEGFKPPQEMHPRSSCGGAAGAEKPPQEMQSPPQIPQSPPQLLRSNRKEPSRTVSKATVSKRVTAQTLPCPDDVDPQTWADWLTLRKAKRAPVTETVTRAARREAEKAGLPLTRFLEIWCARGSQGLEADWLKPHERAAAFTTGAIHAVNPNGRQRGESLAAHSERINRQLDEREQHGNVLLLAAGSPDG